MGKTEQFWILDFRFWIDPIPKVKTGSCQEFSD